MFLIFVVLLLKDVARRQENGNKTENDLFEVTIFTEIPKQAKSNLFQDTMK